MNEEINPPAHNIIRFRLDQCLKVFELLSFEGVLAGDLAKLDADHAAIFNDELRPALSRAMPAVDMN